MHVMRWERKENKLYSLENVLFIIIKKILLFIIIII